MKKSIKTKNKIWVLSLEDSWNGYDFPSQIILTELDLEEALKKWIKEWDKGDYPGLETTHFGVSVECSRNEVYILEHICFYDEDGYLEDPDDIEIIATYKYSEHN
jgi:hypothetical protein